MDKDKMSEEFRSRLNKYSEELCESIVKWDPLDEWTASIDHGTGALVIEARPYALYCTPFWEGNETLVISLMDYDGDELGITDIILEPTFNKYKDAHRWLELIKSYISDNELKPEDMAARSYIQVWGEGYMADDQANANMRVVGHSFFTKENGFEAPFTTSINELLVGGAATCGDLSGTTSVVRTR